MLKLAILLSGVAVLAVLPLWAQEGQDPEQYRIEYTAYQDATSKEGDEKIDALVKFYKDFPESSLLPYVKGEFLRILQAAYDNKDADKVASLTEKFQTVEPDEIGPVYLTADLYFKQGQYAQAISWAEKVHSQTDNAEFKKQARYIIVFSALNTGNAAKIRQHGPDVIEDYGPEATYAVSTELMRQAVASGNVSEAAKWASKALEGYAAVESSANAETRQYISEHRLTAAIVLGENAFSRQQWNRAIREFQNVLSMTNDKEKVAQAYYKIGMSHWKAGQVEPDAMKAFARGHKLGTGQFARQCFKHLEELYKIRHNGSTAGMDEFIQEAVAE
ncbi:MAG TPA: tetratricopeptide repeat protein [Acidobacteriota bacterium]|nr:tetratricopeptide repeat protein [Acidobacteriota bacterium]